MTLLRPDERCNMHTSAITILGFRLPPGRASGFATVPRLPPLFILFSLVSLLVGPVGASPVGARALEKRDGQELSPKIWIPIVVAVIVLFIVAVMSWMKISFRKVLGIFNFAGSASAGATMTGRSATTTRELTAEQLAGTINGETQPPAAAPRTRRTRRNRRTPSQMSVTSLPAYNKEPGEEELVIFRGRDMEDATMPAAIVMNSVDEDREGSIHSNDNSQVSRYSPMPTTANDTPLLHSDGAYGDLSLQSLSSPEQDRLPRRSYDSNSHETSSLMRMESNQLPEGLPDPRGEAPAYFEVVDRDASSSPQVQSDAIPAEPASPESRPPRQSGFRTLLNRMSIVAHPHSHARGDSAGSGFSSNQSHGADMSNSRHRASPSSSSILSSSMFRTLSRQKSIHTLNSARLNSPSMISLNSISAPLTHTVVRTEFTYPKTGPTPEQLKLISSRETFTRFGVPYGADAIAYAASTSRLDLPPPDFETASSDIQSPRSAAGPSRLRSSSNAAELQDRPSTADADERNRTSSDRHDNEGDGQQTSSSPAAAVDTPNTESRGTAPTTTETPAPPPSSISTTNNSISKESTQSQSADSQSSAAQTPTRTVSEFGKLSAPPPSSYHDVTAGSSRSESALSMYSYATAAESLTASTPRRSSFVGADGVELSTPSTPRLGQHTLEATDATATPDAVHH